MPDLRRQCRSPSAPRACVQPRQLHAHAGDAEDGAAVVADQPARKAEQDRREGREPRSLRDLPDGRGRGVGANVRRHPVADRPAAGTTHASMRGAWSDVRQTTAAEVRLDAGKAPRFNVSTQLTGGFDTSCPTRSAICSCLGRSKGRSWLRNDPESGECRFKLVGRMANK